MPGHAGAAQGLGAVWCLVTPCWEMLFTRVVGRDGGIWRPDGGTVLNLAGMWSALDLLSVPTTMEIPWVAMGVATGACAVLAVVFSVAPAALALRHRALDSDQ
ncbi:hypothetical protein [Streptomyces sp. NPDC046805]|uniref:hypothetical protein n=1 Tax=Streptomyces sp. NPDC046805 TaxID=3155134 RepID=UPI0033ECB78B